jgi:hypothetical protein
MGTFAKIIVTAVVLGCIQQVVESVSDACRPNPKAPETK